MGSPPRLPSCSSYSNVLATQASTSWREMEGEAGNESRRLLNAVQRLQKGLGWGVLAELSDLKQFVTECVLGAIHSMRVGTMFCSVCCSASSVMFCSVLHEPCWILQPFITCMRPPKHDVTHDVTLKRSDLFGQKTTTGRWNQGVCRLTPSFWHKRRCISGEERCHQGALENIKKRVQTSMAKVQILKASVALEHV